MMRIEQLRCLQVFLNSGFENYNEATNLEHIFLGQRTGCRCKYNQVRSALNQFWETTGKKELEELENA